MEGFGVGTFVVPKSGPHAGEAGIIGLMPVSRRRGRRKNLNLLPGGIRDALKGSKAQVVFDDGQWDYYLLRQLRPTGMAAP